jgi:6,7-dimethyl-8-ribityllumazine synthase
MATANKNLSDYDKATIPNAKDFRFGIVVSEWNDTITEGLIYGSKKMQEKQVDAVIAIGSVIQGETKHFDFVCEGVTQGIKDLNVLHDTPVIFCVLTDNTMQQAIDRSGGKHGNKGTEAAIAAIKMADIRKNA